MEILMMSTAIFNCLAIRTECDGHHAYITHADPHIELTIFGQRFTIKSLFDSCSKAVEPIAIANRPSICGKEY